MSDRMIYQVDETRKKILEAAEALFTENGFFETQIKDIATKTGVSRNTIYRYFQDKSDLAMKIIEMKLNTNYASYRNLIENVTMDNSLNGLEKLEKIITHSWIDSHSSYESKLIAEFDAYYSGNRISEKMKERFHNLDSKEMELLIVQIIDSGKEDKSIRCDIDSHLMLVTIINSVRSLNQRIILRGDVLMETKNGETDQMLKELMRLIIDGLRNNRSNN